MGMPPLPQSAQSHATLPQLLIRPLIQLLILILIVILIWLLTFSDSGGRAQALRREVTGKDARQALGPRMGPAARSSREQGRSEGTPKRSVGAG